MGSETSPEKTPGRIALSAAVSLVVLIWAVNFIAAKIGLRSLPPLTLASFRVVLAAAIMLPVYLICAGMRAFAEAGEKLRRGFTLQDLWIFLYMGFFGVSINQMCFTAGLRYTSVNHAAIIVGMGPIYTLVLAVLLKLEQATLKKAIGMLLAFGGIAVMALDSGVSTHSPTLLGDAVTMTGSVGFAMYIVLGKRLGRQYYALTLSAWRHFGGGLLVLPLAISRAVALGGVEHWRAVPWSGWAGLLYMAVFSSAVAYVFYFWALRYLEASQLTAFTYLLPVVATLLGIGLLGEEGSWGQVLGGVLALGGVYWIESGRASVVKVVTSQ